MAPLPSQTVVEQLAHDVMQTQLDESSHHWGVVGALELSEPQLHLTLHCPESSAGCPVVEFTSPLGTFLHRVADEPAAAGLHPNEFTEWHTATAVVLVTSDNPAASIATTLVPRPTLLQWDAWTPLRIRYQTALGIWSQPSLLLVRHNPTPPRPALLQFGGDVAAALGVAGASLDTAPSLSAPGGSSPTAQALVPAFDGATKLLAMHNVTAMEGNAVLGGGGVALQQAVSASASARFQQLLLATLDAGNDTVVAAAAGTARLVPFEVSLHHPTLNVYARAHDSRATPMGVQATVYSYDCVRSCGALGCSWRLNTACMVASRVSTSGSVPAGAQGGMLALRLPLEEVIGAVVLEVVAVSNAGVVSLPWLAALDVSHARVSLDVNTTAETALVQRPGGDDPELFGQPTRLGTVTNGVAHATVLLPRDATEAQLAVRGRLENRVVTAGVREEAQQQQQLVNMPARGHLVLLAAAHYNGTVCGQSFGFGSLERGATVGSVVEPTRVLEQFAEVHGSLTDVVLPAMASTSQLGNGPHCLVLHAEGSAGQSATLLVSLIVDTVAPTFVAVQPNPVIVTPGLTAAPVTAVTSEPVYPAFSLFSSPAETAAAAVPRERACLTVAAAVERARSANAGLGVAGPLLFDDAAAREASGVVRILNTTNAVHGMGVGYTAYAGDCVGHKAEMQVTVSIFANPPSILNVSDAVRDAFDTSGSSLGSRVPRFVPDAELGGVLWHDPLVFSSQSVLVGYACATALLWTWALG